MRYALVIEYDGSGYCGWQRQKHCRSVQSVLEKALSEVADSTIELTCAGRTDTGVHAMAQVAHFDSAVERSNKAWLMGANTLMEKPISILWVNRVADDFHARYSASSRRYRYVILNRHARPGLQHGKVAWVFPELNYRAMKEAAKYLVGEHDFSTFRAAGCQARHAVREITSLEVRRFGEQVQIDITANAFLHNMVRIIAGSLIKVGKGEEKPQWIQDILRKRDRTLGGVTAVPDGLYFLGADYPEKFSIPRSRQFER